MKQGGVLTATAVPSNGNGTEFDLTDASVSPKEELEQKLDHAREQLLTLRRQQEELERQKGELEELRRRQEEYIRGKREMVESLTRGLVVMERDQIESQRRAELCGKTMTAFRDYLEQLHGLNDEEWTSTNVRSELSHALGIIDNSRLEFNRARTKLDCLNPSAGQPAEAAPTTETATIDWPELLRYLRLGAAASAPLIAAGTIWLIIALIHWR